MVKKLILALMLACSLSAFGAEEEAEDPVWRYDCEIQEDGSQICRPVPPVRPWVRISLYSACIAGQGLDIYTTLEGVGRGYAYQELLPTSSLLARKQPAVYISLKGFIAVYLAIKSERMYQQGHEEWYVPAVACAVLGGVPGAMNLHELNKGRK